MSMEAQASAGAPAVTTPLAIICGGGNLPFVVADAVQARGRRVVLFPIRGFADSQRVTGYPHHWIWLGRYGAFRRLALREGCRDVVMIGGLQRPSLRQIRLDWKTVRVFPRIVAAFRGGDDHLLTGIARIMEDDGLHFVASHAAAPDILVPEGVLGSIAPGERERADMARGLALIDAIGAFDVGQAAVVANNQVLAVEAAEGTDGMLARIAELRKAGRIRTPVGAGVLVKAPKVEQDRRFDLPSIGVRTIELAASAGLAGIAVEAGGAITANLAAVVQAADAAGLFIVGSPPRHTATPSNTAVVTSKDRGGLDVFMVACETSADALGAGLIKALSSLQPGALTVRGVGGEQMAAVGLASLFPIEEVAAIGFMTVLARLPTIGRRLYQTVDAIVAASPDVLILIDAPDFTHRVATRVRRRLPLLPIVKYVSPTVWIWRPGRARAMRRWVDLLLAVLPFEPRVHRELGGPPCTYVGHPLLARLDELRPSAEEAKAGASEPPLVLVLPGSRVSEVRRLAGIFGEALAMVEARYGPIDIVLPTLPYLAPEIAAATKEWRVRPRIVTTEAEKFAAYRRARAALAASGTATLELALAGVPLVAGYRIPIIEGLILRRIVRVHPAVGVRSPILANLVLGEQVVPEFLQARCTAADIAPALIEIIADTAARRRQVEAFAKLDGILGVGGEAPSLRAANAVLELLGSG
jgi:lipid-A-disaccharide synthase